MNVIYNMIYFVLLSKSVYNYVIFSINNVIIFFLKIIIGKDVKEIEK